MFVRIKPSGSRKYVQIVESFRDNSNVKQRVIANLGRLDILQQTGPKQLVGNRDYAHFLKIDKDALVIDLEKVEQDSIFDGKYILTTKNWFGMILFVISELFVQSG